MRVFLLLVACLATVVLGGVMSGASHGRRLPTKQKLMRYMKTEVAKPENRAASCTVCSFAVDGLQLMIKSNKTDNEIAGFLINICDDLNIEQPHVCKHIIEAFQDEVVFVLERTLFTPAEICGAFIHDCGTSEDPLTVMWNLTIPDGKPPVKPWPTIPSGKPTMKVLHLSDIHIDRQYAVGSEAYCQLDEVLNTYAMCCRADDGNDVDITGRKPKPIHVPAGKWGMPYACDLPYATFDSALKHISKTNTDLDYIIITGDFEAHDSWDYTEDLTKDNMENITAALLLYFPNTPVYIAIGNHEGVPQDAMAPHTMAEYDQRGPQWLYTIMKDMWAHWIPSSALPDVQYRASYAVYPKPGLKLISINTIYCSEFNFYLYIDQVDPDATLQWLIDQLSDSEGKGELVHIISHIPPGANYCLKGWSHNFFEIIKRYENTIAQQFYGHTHYDHFQVYYESANPNTRPFHFNWISPSLTTYDWINPSYRIYTIDGGYDGATYTVKDADTYYADVEAANNANKEPVWQLEYSHRSFYNMTDFSPQSWSDLSDRLWTDKNLFRKFVKLYYRNAYNNECWQDTTCHRNFICELKKGRSYDDSFCAGLMISQDVKMSSTPPSLDDAASQTCHICYDTSDGLHFGVYTCRACAAFFRRTVSLRLDYTCRADAKCSIDKSARNMCRYCRFQKCLNTGMQITAVQQARDGIGKRKDIANRARVHTPTPLERPTSSTDFYQRPFIPQFQPNMGLSVLPSAFSVVRESPRPIRLLLKMQEGYNHFLTIRKATHSLVENDNITQMFQKNSQELRPSNFDSAKKVCQLEAHLVTDIVNTYFFPFGELPFDEKVVLFKNFFCYLSHTDRAYQSYKMFGHDENDDRLLMPDGGFIKSSELEKFYANAEGVHSPPEEAAKIFRPAMEYILHVIMAHMRRIAISELEYVAILGFFLWNEAVASLSPETVDTIHDTQEAILSDLHSYYRQLGLDGVHITKKTGQLMLLLPKLTRSVVMLRENSELAELFNMFEADVCCKSFKGDVLKINE